MLAVLVLSLPYQDSQCNLAVAIKIRIVIYCNLLQIYLVTVAF